mmetsp:Transcript_10292/g.31001  ORF Transcript_10292/g.31001 Transcript_10292/m.31001 type:complete len:228 (+) Transcript_10292:277-960(+)
MHVLLQCTVCSNKFAKPLSGCLPAQRASLSAHAPSRPPAAPTWPSVGLSTAGFRSVSACAPAGQPTRPWGHPSLSAHAAPPPLGLRARRSAQPAATTTARHPTASSSATRTCWRSARRWPRSPLGHWPCRTTWQWSAPGASAQRRGSRRACAARGRACSEGHAAATEVGPRQCGRTCGCVGRHASPPAASTAAAERSLAGLCASAPCSAGTPGRSVGCPTPPSVRPA